MSVCITPISTFTCSNPDGVTCEKVASQVFVLSANTVCAAGEYPIASDASGVSPEFVSASSLMFGAFLAAAALIWGAKRVYALLASGGVGHD